MNILSIDIGEYDNQEKNLKLAHHIATLDENSLANEVFVTQKQFNFPGLVQEVSELSKELNRQEHRSQLVQSTVEETRQ